GPYWQDSDDDEDIDTQDTRATAGAMGLALSGVNVGMVLMKPVVGAGQPPSEESFYALKASGSVDFVGITGLTLSAEEITVEINGSSGPAGTTVPVVDFQASDFGQPDGLHVVT